MRSSRSRLRLGVACAVGAMAGWASRTAGRGDGTTLPGVVIRRIAPDALAQLSAGRSVALVSGTNGKLTTTAMLVAALDRPTTTNAVGSNLTSGIIAALAASSHPMAVLEVDELYLRTVAIDTQADLIVALNLTRDQLDRTGEVGKVERSWRAAFEGSGAQVVANAADPHVVSAVGDTPATWVDPGWAWVGDSTVCPACTALLRHEHGRWSCACGLRQPQADYRVDGTTLELPDGSTLHLEVSLPGQVNVGNAAFAVAAAEHYGVPAREAAERIATVRELDGRYSMIPVGERSALLMLAKNPAGCAAALGMLRPDDAVLISVNAQIIDGADTSWLWDAPFEQLAGRAVGAHGDNRHDLAVRLEIAGADPLVDADIDALARRLPQAPRLVLIATYSSFYALRRRR